MKTILITGAASGIGHALALRMLHQGWYVGLLDLNGKALEAFAQEWGEHQLFIRQVDVCIESDVKDAITAFMEKAGVLDVLFNGAGILSFEHFENIPLERHQAIFDVNCSGLLHCCYHAFPYMKAHGERVSHIINMSSASSAYGVPGLASYAASKAWVKSLSESLNIEWQRFGIYVSAVEPPFVDTPMIAGQRHGALQNIGASLVAEDVVAVVVEIIAGGSQAPGFAKVHWRVGLQYKLSAVFTRFMPAALMRMMMKRLCEY